MNLNLGPRLTILLLSFVFLGCSPSEQETPKSGQSEEVGQQTETSARFKTNKGDFVLSFHTQAAPATTKRISHLIEKGFYDGLTFHRVVPGTLVQTGDPTATGRGGSGKNIRFESNDKKHVSGAVGMARMPQDKDSADSQFYITLKSMPHLDGDYTIFANLQEGQEVIEQIEEGDKILSATLEHKTDELSR